MKRMGTLVTFAALASCWRSSGPTHPPTAVVGEVGVELASVNLGDDCDDETAAVPSPGPSGSMHSSARPSPGAMAGSRAYAPIGNSVALADAVCIPTSMQLTVEGKGTGGGTIRVKSVVLVDSEGHVIGDLAPGKATRWADERYIAWDQKVRGGESVNASYKLLGLDWGKVPGGRISAQDRTFTLRVTVEVGSGERTIDKSVAMPKLSIEPGVVT